MCLAVATTVARKLRGVERTVAVAVLQVVGTIEVKLAVATCQGVATHGRTIDEEIRHDINKRLTLGVTSHVIGKVLPVVDDVVDILVDALHLEITCRVVHQEVPIERNVVGLHQTACRMSHQPLTDDGVHQRDILRSRAFVIPVDGKVLVLSPGKRTVVEDHVLTIGNAAGILVLGSHGTHTEAHVANDDVVGSREANTIAIDGNALAGSCLACHIEVVLEDDAGVDTNDTTHVEHHDTVGLADGITQRPLTRVVEIGDMIDTACTSACGVTAPALSAGES